MTSEYTTIPPGLLNTWGAVQPHGISVSDDATETFVVQPVAIGRAKKALSVGLEGLGWTRETGLETNADAFPILGARRRSTSDETSVDSCHSTSTGRPQRSATVTLPVFVGRHSGINNPQAGRRSSAEAKPELRRTTSSRSWAPGLDVIRRASIAVEDAVENISSIVRRSTLSDVYEKAKVRQVQLKRSTVAQIAFQYAFYLLLLASIYFVLVGIPLWKGVVWYIYILFVHKLVVPAGTAAFLGIGFLYVVSRIY